MSINREHLTSAAHGAIADILYSAISDTANEILVTVDGVDEAAVLKAANAVIARYTDEGIKIRKKPTPRPRAPVTKPKKSTDLASAANKLMAWIKHPVRSEYSFANKWLSSGYPLRNNVTGHWVGMITEDETHPPTKEDLIMGQMFSLEYVEEEL